MRSSPGVLFWRRPTLARPIAVLPSGLQRFTSVFGMGTGGATALLSPERRSACAARLWCVIRDSLNRQTAHRAVATTPIHDSQFTAQFSKNYQQSTNDYQPAALVRWHLHTGSKFEIRMTNVETLRLRF